MNTRDNLLNLLQIERASQMNLLNITVGGFRNIKLSSLSFDSITALVGLNGTGKSNLIDAIDFGFDFIHCSTKMRKVMLASKPEIPILASMAGKNYSFTLEAKTESTKQPFYIQYGFELSWQTDFSPARIVSEYLNIKRDEKGQKYNTFISRKDNNAKYRPSVTGRCDKVIKIDDYTLVLSKLLSFDELFYADILAEINSIQYFVERHLDARPSFEPSPFVIKGFQELELEGIQSIPRAIYYLKQDFNSKFQLLVNSFRQLFPDIKDIEVDEIKLNQPKKLKISEDAPFMFSDNIYTLSILDDRMIQPVSFERLSDGTKRVFLMLTMAIIADIKGLSLIAIEEPENSIHPGLLQNYIDVLSQLINNCKIIITSHSPYVIQCINPHSLYIAHSNDTGESVFERIASSKVRALVLAAAEYDNSVGEYIFNILSSNDARDYLMEFLEPNG